jgi:FlaA1/EpsC-like NDP-sugar epimerase
MTVRELLNSPDAGIRNVRFIDDDVRKRRMRVRGYPELGPYDTLAQLVASGSVDAVVVSSRAIDAARLRELAALCSTHATQLSRLFVGLEPLVDSERGIAAGAVGGRGRKLHIAAVKTSPIDGSR